MTALWSQAELTAAFGAAPTASLGAAVGGVSIDSRTLEAGDLFIAIKGAAHDGHDHVARAFESGAVAAVVSRERAGRLAALGPLFAVDDTLSAMERLGVAARARSKARIVAVTGSVGKTTVKEMLRAMLSACGATHASAHSYNNHWGVPLTLARMPASARYGVLEIGMNHAGEIAPLTRMARPHAALVTTIAPVHIEYLGSIEAIADAKAEIFLGLEPRGAAALNHDAPQFERLAKAAVAHGARVLKFGRGADCDARLIEVEAIDGGSRVTARVLGRELAFVLGAPGVHMAEDALGALLAAEALGADLDLTEALRTAPVTAKAVRDYSRVFFASASDEIPDKQGRITVPAALRGYAGLDRDCIVIGANTRLEIWDSQAWETYLTTQEDSFAGASQEVFPGIL